MSTDDPIAVRRARIARWARGGLRLGYGLFGVAIAAFAAGLALDLPRPLVTLVVASLAVGSAVLAPAIVVSYGIKAAEREDRSR